MARRHASLIPLSRDHHDALTLAFRLHHPAPPHPVTPMTPASTLADRVAWMLGLWESSLRAHFAAEEEALFPCLERELPAGDPHRALLQRLRDEHRQLAALHAVVAGATHPRAGNPGAADEPQLATALTAFADLLEVHVRCEERELFVAFEALVPPAAADALGPAIATHFARRGDPSCDR